MRSEKEVQAELDKALEEYGEAVDHGDEAEQERLSDKICDLEVEFDWLML